MDSESVLSVEYVSVPSSEKADRSDSGLVILEPSGARMVLAVRSLAVLVLDEEDNDSLLNRLTFSRWPSF